MATASKDYRSDDAGFTTHHGESPEPMNGARLAGR
jgi:hypothetical protein